MQWNRPAFAGSLSNSARAHIPSPGVDAAALPPVYALGLDGRSKPLMRLAAVLDHLRAAWQMPARPARDALLQQIAGGRFTVFSGWNMLHDDYWVPLDDTITFGEDPLARPVYVVTLEGSAEQERFVAVRRDPKTNDPLLEVDFHEAVRKGERAQYLLMRALEARPQLTGLAGLPTALEFNPKVWLGVGLAVADVERLAAEGPVAPGGAQVRHGVEFPLPESQGVKISDEWRVAVFKLRHIDKLGNEQLATLIGRKKQQLAQIIGTKDPNSPGNRSRHLWLTDALLKECGLPVPNSAFPRALDQSVAPPLSLKRA